MPKNILVLYGADIGTLEEITNFWDQIKQRYPDTAIAYQDIKSFYAEAKSGVETDPQDLIIINAHGDYFSEKGKKPRFGHLLMTEEQGSVSEHESNHEEETSSNGPGYDGAIETKELVKVCASISKRVFVASCHSGAFMNDLEKDELLGTQIITNSGSKYVQFEFSPHNIDIAIRFLKHETVSLENFLFLSPETIVLHDGQGHSYKIRHTRIDKGSDAAYCETVYRDSVVTRDYKPIGELGQEFKDRALAIAYGKNNVIEARSWLDVGANPNITDHRGTPILVDAVLAKNEEMIELLIEKNADPHKLASSGFSALETAVDNDRDEILALMTKLLAAKQTTNTTSSSSANPLQKQPRIMNHNL